jgi:hypothetical protein
VARETMAVARENHKTHINSADKARSVCVKCEFIYVKSQRSGRVFRSPGSYDPKNLRSWHMNVLRLSALGTALLYPQEMCLLLISVRG